TDLVQLSLAWNPVTDAGLLHLEPLAALSNLTLAGTKVTAAGIATLQKTLPTCQIEWDDPEKTKMPQGNSRIAPDRRVAEWALGKGGAVAIQDQRQMVDRIAAVADLPPGEFQLIRVNLPQS